MDAIKEYLQSEDPDYNAGVRLLREHHKNRNLVNQLQRKESVSHWAKLRYELAKLAGDLGLATLPLSLAPAGAASELPTAETLAVSPDSPDLAELTRQLTPEALAEVEGLTRTMGDVYGRKVALSNSLGDITSRADRKRTVDEIQRLEDEYTALAEQKRLVVERGTPTPEPAAGEEQIPTLAELLKDRGNLRSNLSKARKKAEESKTAEKKADYEQKAGKLAAELEALELTIKKLQEQPQA